MNMDLLCCESETVSTPFDDPVLFDDCRVFENLLVSEERYTLSTCYFRCLQTDLKPYMRRIVADWMQEVCDEEECQEQVFPLSVNIMDRFLSLVRVRKSQLQLIGAVCLFLASKLKQSRPLSAERLCHYTENSITIDELLDWELLVLSRLKWDVAAITPLDFVNHIFRRLPILHGQELIRRHVHTFIGLCAADARFSMYPPSMIAAASIGAAVQGLMSRLQMLQWSSPNEFLARLHEITGIDVDCLRACLEQIEATVLERLSAAIAPPQSNLDVPLDDRVNHKLAEQQQNDCLGSTMKAETPTDVQDVLF